MKMIKMPRPFAALAFIITLGFTTALFGTSLPQGKANFTVVLGNLDSVGTVWCRLGHWVFDPDGTVQATFWQWDTVAEKGKTALNSHTCTFDGIMKTCIQYTPTGWLAPAGQYFGWTGTYSYNTGTGVLAISWSGGVSESWTVTLPEPGLAKVDFISSSGTGYAVTHGKGYGSNAAWTVFKTMNTMPRGTAHRYYRGTIISTSWSGKATDPYVVYPPAPGAWAAEAANFSNMVSSSNGLALHMKSPSSPDVCTAKNGCFYPATGHTGIIYHFASTNTGRGMVYNNHCACLPDPDTYPCYDGNIHPHAVDQIIDDSGEMRGMVLVHQQDQPGSVGFSYSLEEWLLDLVDH
jgi:hypothetical protein